jgi:UMF1 family MFS transporter
MPPSRTTQVWSWALYDFANTIFSMNIVSMYFPLWVTRDMGGEDIHYSIALSASMIAAGLTMPLIGALSDSMKRRMPFLIGFTLMCAAFTAGIRFGGGLFTGLFFFALANYGYQAALVPYDTLLPEVSRGKDVGRVSGLGVGLGYAGSICGLMMVKPFVDAHGRTAAFIPTAVLFAVFALPTFIFVKDSGARPASRPLDIRRVFRKIYVTLKNTRRYPGLSRFLLANLIFSDAVNTVIVFMAVYASKVIGMDDGAIRTFLIASTVFAALGSFASGRLTDRLGPKRALTLALVSWVFTLTLAGLSFSRGVFWAVGPLAGISLGGTWVASRALVARLTPPRKFGEVYGLYNLGGKFGFVVGPLLWGAIVLLLKPYGAAAYRAAILSLVVFVLVALYIMRRVPEPVD